MTIAEASANLQSGKLSASNLAETYLAKIAVNNPKLNAYLEVFPDVLEQAKLADEKLKRGDKSPLLGVPLAIKDNILIKGRRVSAASRMLENYEASYDATVIRKLKSAGAIFLGRTNMDEFAMGSSTENSAYGPTRNPHDLERVPGGSSGGSAVAVAADLCVASLGSDTGGSIRQPASFCGVVGLKPTYGAVSRSGLIAMASSLDQIGPLTQTVADAEILFKIISGLDSLDATSVELPTSTTVPKSKLTIGVPRSFLNQGVDPEVLANFELNLKKIEALGHQIVEINLPAFQYSLACYYVIMPAEVSSNLARFDGVRYGLHRGGDSLLADYLQTRGEGFGAEARRRIILGTYVLSAGYYDAYYAKAKQVQKLIKQDLQRAFSQIDLIITPTAPTTAFRFGEKTADPLQMYLEDIFTVPVNLSGVPALSIPSGRDKNNLPFGLQIIAPHFQEERLFSLGKQLFDHVLS